MSKIIGMGEWAISNDTRGAIKTFSLGSCVALTLYCAFNNVAGMVHIVLPNEGRTSGNSLTVEPGYYATTAVPFLIEKMCSEYRCVKRNLEIKLFGGASSLSPTDPFKIGEKNLAMVKRILTELNLTYDATQTGGSYGRTVQIEVATGRTSVITNRMII